MIPAMFNRSAMALKYAIDRKPKDQSQMNKLQREYHTMFGLPKPILLYSPKYGFNKDGSGPISDQQYKQMQKVKARPSVAKKKLGVNRPRSRTSLMGVNNFLPRRILR
tara:strand:+ start:1072 stop:1395 length:324 start_codon:yes stop_codon:yes gene_type:complete